MAKKQKDPAPKPGQLELTEKQRKAFSVYLRALADNMALKDWTIRIDWDDLPDDAAEEERDNIADVYCAVTIKQMRLRLDETAFIDRDPEEQRRIIVHELIHPHLQAMADQVDRLDKMVGAPVHYVVITDFMEKLEVATDDLARTLAPGMPLIDWSITKIG